MTADRLTPQREAEIAARWEHIPADEQPRIAVTNSSRGGSLLNALGHARHDMPALLAELAAVREELAEQKRATEYFDAQSKRRKAERDEARAALREAADQVAELESNFAGAVIASEALHRRLTEEQLAGSALYAALTMPTTPQQRQAALDKFTAVAQQVFGSEAAR